MKYVTYIIVFNCAVFGRGMTKKTSSTFTSKITLKVSLQYNLYLPNNYYDTSDDYPLVLFLHGAGERGDSLDMVETHGIPKLIKNGKDFPFITLAPQCPRFQYWPEPVNVKALIQLVEKIITQFRIDHNRVYSTGLSMGGFGTLAIAKERPDLFAGIIPVCGGVDTTNIKNLKTMPIWLFHGAEDEVVPVRNSKIVYQTLKKINPKIYLTIYPDINHNSWDMTYDNTDIYDWLLKNRKYDDYKMKK